MKPTASDLDSINDLNAILLKAEELVKVIDNYGRARELCVCSKITGMLTEKRLYLEEPYKARAIMLRLKALSVMIENGELENWLPADKIGVVPAIARDALVSAAASHPLSVIDGDFTFEKESFLRRVLESAKPEGSRSN